VTITPTTPSAAAIDIEWLAQNCYIQFAHEGHEYRNVSWHKDENEDEEFHIIRFELEIKYLAVFSNPIYLNY
jgi:hypothetical protein